MTYPNITRKRKIILSFFYILCGFCVIFFGNVIAPSITYLTFTLGVLFIIGGILELREKTSAKMRKESAANYIKICDEILKKNPNNVKAIIDKGIALKVLEQYENAIKCFNQALQIEPDNIEAFNNKENILKMLKI